ncbi:MAG TPA: acetyltransferase [Candidatus Competibacter sp.]|nr:acetyltransferase [Candidatus Competibacter sp.]
MSDERRLAEAIRAACIEAALAAYEEGGVLGLCAEGRWEYAISTLRQLNMNALLASHSIEPTIESPDGNQPEYPSDQPS